MKLSLVMCASFVALAALALATGGAFASINLNSSRSNIYRAMDPNDQTAEKTCAADGGTVFMDKDGDKVCLKLTKAPKAPAPTVPVKVAPANPNPANPN